MWHASEFESRACQGQVTEDRVVARAAAGRLLSGYGGGEASLCCPCLVRCGWGADVGEILFC